MEVTFRPLSDDDLPMLHRWLNEPGVVRWWEGDDVSWDAVVADYGAAGRSGEPFEHWIASWSGADIGWIQCYAAVDNLDETEQWWSFGIDRSATRRGRAG